MTTNKTLTSRNQYCFVKNTILCSKDDSHRSHFPNRRRGPVVTRSRSMEVRGEYSISALASLTQVLEHSKQSSKYIGETENPFYK